MAVFFEGLQDPNHRVSYPVQARQERLGDDGYAKRHVSRVKTLAYLMVNDRSPTGEQIHRLPNAVESFTLDLGYRVAS